ncbi:MAG: anthranilate phosphoribosyltransferase family protein [Leptolyngbya sp. SIO4C1]|nr:anthranilate phosphoribosyltransferase family protein [Leptolyngbya sp. SIO4C1]
MSEAFRTLLKKVGSGSHTAKDLSRTEAATATRLMLEQVATPAQIGAFMIAHRIKRPTPVELAGLLDCYDALGPKLAPIRAAYPVTVLSCPYDGRSRTAPVAPLTALLLAANQAPVVLHGGDRMPTKQGLPFIEIFQALGLPWHRLSLEQVQQVLAETGLGFVYLPNHFPQAQAMVPYRDQIGKRPPFATIEIMWSPYAGETHLVSGYVHPPTEDRTCETFHQRETALFTTVKGLEGSCDLPRDRTAILGLGQLKDGQLQFERLLLHPRDYGFTAIDPPLASLAQYMTQLAQALTGGELELAQSAIWNGGFYLWRCGAASTLEQGFEQARATLASGRAAKQLEVIKQAMAASLKTSVQPAENGAEAQ